MGYTVRYGPDSPAEAAWKRGAGKRRTWLWSIGAAAVLAAWLLLSGSAGKLGQLLIPGDPEVTKAAFSHFTEELREGAGLQEAVTAFCREVLDSGAAPE